MGRRLASFRSGDRAEKMGIVLLQGLCAVAEIPRQEDFGLSDALATLLRRDGRFVHAEDSFLVQFKSRSEKVIKYLGTDFDELRSQDVSVFIGQVDRRGPQIELHSLGPALAHPNFNDARGLVAYLRHAGQSLGLTDDVLHVPLTRPILRWSMAEVEDLAFTTKAYEVLKAHLVLERWNRQQRLSGTSRQIRWETNETPTSAGETQMMNRARERQVLTETVPSIRVLAARGLSHPELLDPVRSIVRWLESQGVCADPGATFQTMIEFAAAQDRMKDALARVPTAEVAITFEVVGVGPDFVNFWVHAHGADGKGSSSRHHGTASLLRDQGFEVVVDGTTASLTLGLMDRWLTERRLVEVGVDDPTGSQLTRVFLFKRLEPSGGTT